MARFLVQLKEAYSHPDKDEPKTFDYIITNDDIINEMYNNRNFISVQSAVTSRRYYLPIQSVAYIVAIPCVTQS